MFRFVGRGRTRRARRCVAGLFALGVCASLTLAVPASAATEPPPELLAGVSISGATITTPGAPVRKLDANQATAFMQSWLPDSVYTQPQLPNTKPPANLPVSRLTVVSVFRGANLPLTVLYASDGTTAWVGMPPQGFGWASVPNERWIAAPQSKRVQQAFAGKLQPVRQPDGPTTTPSVGTPSSTAQPATTSSTDGDSDSKAGWLVGGAVVVVIAGLTIFTLRRRRPATPAP